MAPQLLNSRIVFVKDPTILPNAVAHHEAIDALANVNKLVILLSHGNKYKFPPGWTLPENVRLIEYDLSTSASVERGVKAVRDALKPYDVTLTSRHLDYDDPMPMLLAGSCISLSAGMSVAFINKPSQYIVNQDPNLINEATDWDLL